MIPLASKTNVTAPGGAFPYGNIKDNTGIGDGTPINKDVYADFHQFFARLAALSSITPNGFPEDQVNGFQYMEAFLDMANSYREERFYGAGTTNLTDADVGCLVIKINAAAGGFILPPLTTLNNFKKITILNTGAGDLALVPDGSDVFQPSTGTLTLKTNESVLLEASFLNSPTSPCWNVVNLYRFDTTTTPVTPTLGAGWTGTCQYFKDKNGFVHLRGTLTCANSTASYVDIFTLPSGFRPTNLKKIPIIIDNAYTTVTEPCWVGVTTAGVVSLNTQVVTNPNTLTVYLDGVSFYTGW
jgi:hypothetical protein